MEKSQYIYVRFNTYANNIKYQGIRCATEEEHLADSHYLPTGETERQVMSCESLSKKSHLVICNEILSVIFTSLNFTDDEKEQIEEDVRLLAETLADE